MIPVSFSAEARPAVVPAPTTVTLEAAPLVWEAIVTFPLVSRETIFAAVLVPSACWAVVLRKETTLARDSSVPVLVTEAPTPEVRPRVCPAVLLFTVTVPVEPPFRPEMVMVPSALALAAFE